LVVFPPNGRFVPITVVGSVSVRPRGAAPIVNFQVVDEYRLNQPSGRVKIVAVPNSPGHFQFKFKVRLPASVAASDKSGRQYFLTVAARDTNGSAGRVFPIIVPNPEQGRAGGTGTTPS
jgi:hypothetical protein